jgi:hypothetical protein
MGAALQVQIPPDRILPIVAGYRERSFAASVHPDVHVTLCVAVSDANTFLTSDWDMPNCRAICDGLMPALSAARTALTCPRVNETFATLACRLCLDDDCFAAGSFVGFGWALGGNLPRRFASWTDAVMSRSSSVSVRYLTALGRSLGRTWRCVAVSVGASLAEARLVGGEPSWTIWVEKRSGVAGLVRSRSMR